VKEHGVLWHDDEIGVASFLTSLLTAVREGGEPTCGAAQARLDQEFIPGIRRTALEGSRPVRLPLIQQAKQCKGGSHEDYQRRDVSRVQ
jgi:hypothetical protein